MDEQAEVKKLLLEKLKTISEDREFLLSVINAAKHIEDRRTVIEFIDNGKDVTYENIILLSLTLYENREENNG